MKVDVEVETRISRSTRARQLEAAFDVPAEERHHLAWHTTLPLDAQPWQVGLIVGPSGSGKTSILRDCFGGETPMTWQGDGVVDDFPANESIDVIQGVCSAVGFNTIPAYLRPFSVLSNGEQFRVTMARRLLESSADSPIVVDEFTSVVDRQVAKIGAHAVQKWVRRNQRQFVAASCHYDVIDWLQPDWTFEPATLSFMWRSVQPRPRLTVRISKVAYSAWRLFAPYHYLTRELNHSAQCYVLFAGDECIPAAFGGVLHRPNYNKGPQVKGLSRLVTLPDWQGLGLAFVLSDTLGAAYQTLGFFFHTYPAHPALITGYDRSPNYQLREKPGNIVNSGYGHNAMLGESSWRPRGRPNAVFRYVGPRLNVRGASALTAGSHHLTTSV